MSITAKVLQLGVPLVTAFHVTRLVVVLLLTGPVFAAWRAAWRLGSNALAHSFRPQAAGVI